MVDRSRSHSSAGRRAGYVVAVLVNLVLLLLTLVWPGWRAVPFLTEAAAPIVPLFCAALIVSMVFNLLSAVFDRRPLKVFGDLVGSILSFVVSLQLWNVFPFSFPPGGFDWAVLVRILLMVAMIGGGIAVITLVVMLGRLAAGFDRGSA